MEVRGVELQTWLTAKQHRRGRSCWNLLASSPATSQSRAANLSPGILVACFNILTNHRHTYAVLAINYHHYRNITAHSKRLPLMASTCDIKAESPCGTPTSRVFGIFELAETILLDLPITDLIHISRVSKQFQSTVTNSKPIQRALFLKPLSGKPVILVKPTPGRMVFLSDKASDISVGVLGNPFAQRVISGINHNKPAVLHQNATWRRMLLSQPPVRRIEDKQGRKFRDDHGVKLLQSLVASEKRPQWYKLNYIEEWEFFKRVKLASNVKRVERPLSADDKSLHMTFGGMHLA